MKTTDMDTYIIVPMEINGHRVKMLWDTGASGSNITRQTFEKCGMENSDKTVTARALSSKSIVTHRLAEEEKCTIGELGFSSNFYITDEDEPVVYQGDTLDGILGCNIINRFYWLFDLSSCNVIVSTKPIVDTSQSAQVILDFEKSAQDIPYCQITLNDTLSTVMIFDSGINGRAFNIPDKFSLYFDFSVAVADTTNSLWSYISRDNNTSIILNLSGADRESGRVLSDFKINGLDLFKSYIALDVDDFFQANNDSGAQGYITANFIRRFSKMYYDPHAKKIYFYKSESDKGLYTGKEIDEFFSSSMNN